MRCCTVDERDIDLVIDITDGPRFLPYDHMVTIESVANTRSHLLIFQFAAHHFLPSFIYPHLYHVTSDQS
jgi:hypothetical protein